MRLALFALLLLTRVAYADDVTRASALFESGNAHYSAGEWAPALKDFEAGYRVMRDPAFLFNIGQCQRHLGRKTDALLSYNIFLREQPNSPSRAAVEKIIANLDDELRKDRLAPPPAATPVKPKEPDVDDEIPPMEPSQVKELEPYVAPLPRTPELPPDVLLRRQQLWIGLSVAGFMLTFGGGLGIGIYATGHEPTPRPH